MPPHIRAGVPKSGGILTNTSPKITLGLIPLNAISKPTLEIPLETILWP